MHDEWESGVGRTFWLSLVLCCFVPSEASFGNVCNLFLKIAYAPEYKIGRRLVELLDFYV